MANHMPIYSQVVPKSQYKKSKVNTRERQPILPRNDFDPLNYNHGGNFQLLNAPLEARMEKVEKLEKREAKRSKEERTRRTQNRVDPNEGKVEAYLRQNQVSIRQQQHRHSAVRQAEHRVNLRSLPLNDVPRPDRTPSDKQRGLPGDRDGKEHRRERDRDRERECGDPDGTPLSPVAPRDRVRKSTSSHRVSETHISADKRRFFCREWAFQKIAHCLEQRPASKTCGALIIGDAGSGKTALCRELISPSPGAQARQQRALNRRLLASHLLQSNAENSLRPGEFVRSLAMQILSHSSRRRDGAERDAAVTRNSCHCEEESNLVDRLKEMGSNEGEECSKPLLGDSEDQRTDEEDTTSRRSRTIDRITERDAYLDSMVGDAALSAHHLPEILPRSATKATNPFINEEPIDNPDFRLYENHENLFLRNISQRQSKELRNSRLVRQSSEPINKNSSPIQKSLSIDQKDDDKRVESSPPKSRIPVANFKYPNKPEIKLGSAENSPKKYDSAKDTSTETADSGGITYRIEETIDAPTQAESLTGNEAETELPEYQNIVLPDSILDREQIEIERLLEKKRSQSDQVPPPIPSLPVSPRTLIANAYYEKLLSEPEIQQALLPHNLDKDPDECFKRAILFPLLEIDPPKQCLFLLVDAVDEGVVALDKSDSPSTSVAGLVSRHQHLLPQWLLLVCTARRHARTAPRMFTGFRKITLDELQRAHVSADVQRYVLARLDTEPRLRARVSCDSSAAAAAAAALDHLRIKSDGCLLYLEKVLDGVADGFIALREIKEIPGTLNGLYLWLAQRLFHGRRFTKIRLLLDVLLAARCGVTDDMLYKCLLTKEYSVSREDFNRRLHLLRRILVIDRAGYLSLFHHSFASWLQDVKHCTRRYLCSPSDGHAALAMHSTLVARSLNALEIHNYVYHMTQLEKHLGEHKKRTGSEQQDEILDLHTIILLWVLDSGCDIETALRKENESFRHRDSEKIETIADQTFGDQEAEGKDSASAPSPLEAIMPELSGGESRTRWDRDQRVLCALLELTREQADRQIGTETENPQGDEIVAIVEEDPVLLDPALVHELAAKGDDEALAVLLKRHPSLVEAADASGGTALHVAARAGRARCAEQLLAAGARRDKPDGDGWSPLRAAAWAGHTEVVEVLLEFGCDVDCVDADNRTALRAASWSGHVAVVSRLLSAGADPDLADAEGRTPLIAAAYMGHVDIVRALLARGAHIDHKDEDGRTALSVAALCASGGPVAALLLERGADVTAADRDGAVPLLVAAFEGHTEICEMLLEAEADVEAADASGRTALWAACAAGHGDTTRLLLFWGCCVDAMDGEGRTVLTTAAAQGNVEVVRQLLDRGLDEHHRDNSGWTPLHYAAFEGHVEVCEALLEAGAKVDEADNDGKGALMLAAQEGHTALVELLADHWGAPLDQRAHDGKTALRLAALEGHFDTVTALWSRGADVDALDADRRSTLYVLALDNRVGMARYLITTCGASVDCTDTEGRTPLHVSAWQGHTDMVNLLIKVGGAVVDGRDRCRRTALHAASWRGRTQVLRALLAHGADPAAVCTQGATPLGIAAQEGHEECVLWLLQHGADPMQADHCGRTPLAVARRAGHSALCRLLERHGSSATHEHATDSPELKRRSGHSSNSTKSSILAEHEVEPDLTHAHDKQVSRAHLSLSFAQQVARVGRGRRERDRNNAIPENHAVVEKDSKLRSYAANERDADLRGYACDRDRKRDERHGHAQYERDNMSPLYASPPRSPVSDICSPTQPQLPLGCEPAPSGQAALTDTHFNRDTHMRIILGRDTRPPTDRHDTKSKRNGIVTNPAMRLVANVRNGLDSAAANIRRTGVALAASASLANPAVKSNAFQWRKETPL